MIEGGRVKRLSVAVLVDGIYAKVGNAAPAYQERPKEELDRIAALVRTAIGFDGKRGDQLEVVNLRFAEAPPSFADSICPGWPRCSPSARTTCCASSSWPSSPSSPASSSSPWCGRWCAGCWRLTRRTIGGHGGGMLAQASPGGGGTAVTLSGNAEPLPGPLPAPRHSTTMQMLDIAKVSGQMQSQSVERVGELIRNNPQETVSILREWIHQEQ